MMDGVLHNLYEVILQRKKEPTEGSYTCYLFEKGLDKVLKKVAEECGEAIIAAKNGDPGETVAEVSDLIYHLWVLLAAQGIPLEDVLSELNARTRKIGNLKSIRKTDRET